MQRDPVAAAGAALSSSAYSASVRALIAIVVLDLALIGWIALGRGVESTADFVFISGGEHHWLDPQKVSWRHDIRVVELLFDPLVRVRLPDLTIEPATAARWDISEDGLVYTFHLRDDARWSNGDPVRADDFLYAWRRALLPDLAADYSQLLFCIDGAQAFFTWRSEQLAAYARRGASARTPAAAAELWQATEQRFAQTVGVSAADDRTLVVRLAQPTPYFIELCAFGTLMPVHAASVSEQASISPDTGLLTQDPGWTRPGRLVCNGPYVMTRRRFKRDVLYEANPQFYGAAAVGPRSILERIVIDKQLQVLMYDDGGADFLPDLPSAGPLAADLVASGREDVHLTPAAGTYFYNFNCLPTLPGAGAGADGTPNPLADPRVRKALSLAIDRQTIVQHVTRLNQPVARTFVPPGALPGYDPPVEAGPRYDLDEARRLLAEAGYPDGRGLRGLKILFNTGFGHEHVAQQIQRNWAEHLGVRVGLEGVESGVFGHRLKSQDYTIARAGWFGDYRDPTTYLDKFITTNGNNDARYSNSTYDAMMAAALVERDPVRRMALYREAEALMLADAPIAPIFQYAEVRLYDPRKVQGLHLNAWDFRRFELVRVSRE